MYLLNSYVPVSNFAVFITSSSVDSSMGFFVCFFKGQNLHIVSVRITANVIKFRTLVACQKGIDKQYKRSSLIRVFPVCYSDSIL